MSIIRYTQKNLSTTYDMQIQEVASLSGFNSLSSFISSFKLNEGITPKQWKQRYVDIL